MSASCSSHNNSIANTSQKYRRVLFIIIAINIVFFVIEFSASIISGSRALQADSLDFLADSMTYSLSLAVLGMSIKWRAVAAIVKAVSLLLMGSWVMGSTIYAMLNLQNPDGAIMGSVAVMAFLANLTCALLLMNYRNGDSNIRSVWLCSRNDAIGNLAVLAAAGMVTVTSSPWPDILVALLMASLFLHSAVSILKQAIKELNQQKPEFS